MPAKKKSASDAHLLRLLGEAEGLPHAVEFVEECIRQFGGVKRFATELVSTYNHPATTQATRVRILEALMGQVVKVSGLGDTDLPSLEQFSDEELNNAWSRLQSQEPVEADSTPKELIHEFAEGEGESGTGSEPSGPASGDGPEAARIGPPGAAEPCEPGPGSEPAGADPGRQGGEHGDAPADPPATPTGFIPADAADADIGGDGQAAD